MVPTVVNAAVYGGMVSQREGLIMGAEQMFVYQCVFHTYRRRPVLVEPVDALARALVEAIALEKGYRLMESAVMPEHVHLLLRLAPGNVPRAMNMFKGIMARRIFQMVSSSF